MSPTSRRMRDPSLADKYLRLRREWDLYKSSVTRRPRPYHSAAYLDRTASAAAPDLLHLLLKSSPRTLVSSLQDTGHPPRPPLGGGCRRLLEAFEKAKASEMSAAAAGSPVTSCSCSSLSTLAWSGGGQKEGDLLLLPSATSSSYCSESDAAAGDERTEWMVRVGWFAFAVAAFVMGVISFGAVLGSEDAVAFVTPT
ncbi:hypothetical protein HPP92_024392 [Vanilla planifolia]|uniref:Uncharacterized protein n=1 Tax=Vanilla planifolia TaxID=51239 RepID=A0A835PNF4_VANPL|nr:hypothetical protein HPP92_024392 [Vanilla planifolia]